jgi:acyl-CoA thioesterase
VNKNRTGLETLLPVVGKPLSGSFSKLLGFILESASNGKVEVSGKPDAQHLNIMDRLHGGYIASLIDTTMGVAAISTMQTFAPFGTVQLNMHFVRKIDLASGKLICAAQVVHTGRTMITIEASARDQTGRICAHGTGTFLIYPDKAP